MHVKFRWVENGDVPFGITALSVTVPGAGCKGFRMLPGARGEVRVRLRIRSNVEYR